MFDPILVPLDGSPLAECVLPHVITIGQAFDAKIMLFQVLDKNRADVASTQFIDLLNWQISKTESKLYLERIGGRLQKSNLQTNVMVSEGPVAEEITEFSQSQKMKLVILSSHGKNGLNKWGIGSITFKTIFSATTSLLIIPAPYLREQPYRRILVPLDGSLRAENVLPMVMLLARFYGSQVQIVHVVKKPEMARHSPPIQEDIDLANRIVVRNQEEALQYLNKVKLYSPMAGVDVKTHLSISDHASVAIHELVDREKIDLVVLSAHGYSGNNQWPYGGMVNNFMLYGKAPMLIIQDFSVKHVKEDINQERIRLREHITH